ncbi:lipopolysaccharide biosynthesis protein [Brevibacillus ginsengisoli]|uniref:lipopolysaccharide biosynthesis protein n=1 Tax=Brevibacillus ginsengisoli TaxID=363854 RepID=UPI003CF30266
MFTGIKLAKTMSTHTANRLRLLIKNRFLQQVLILMTGTGLAQVLTVAIAPVLSRLYDPSSFGVFSLYSSLVSIFSVLACGRYEAAIVLPKREEEAGRLLLLSLLIPVGMASVLFCLLLLVGSEIMAVALPRELVSWFWFLPIHLIAIGFFQALNYWTTRTERYKRLSQAQISRSVTAGTTQVSIGAMYPGPLGLMGGQFLGQLVASSILTWQIWREQRNFWRQCWSWPDIRQIVRAYIRFPLYSAPQALLNALSQNVPAFFLTHAYGAAIVGWYALAHRLIDMPLTFLGQSLTQVYYQRASKAIHERQSLYHLLQKATWMLGLIGILPAIVILMFGSQLFSLFLGHAWGEAGHIAQWLVTWLFMGFLNSPAFVTAQVLGWQRALFVYELTLFVVRTACLFWAVSHLAPLESIALYSMIGCFFNAMLILIVLFFTKRHKTAVTVIDEGIKESES